MISLSTNDNVSDIKLPFIANTRSRSYCLQNIGISCNGLSRDKHTHRPTDQLAINCYPSGCRAKMLEHSLKCHATYRNASKSKIELADAFSYAYNVCTTMNRNTHIKCILVLWEWQRRRWRGWSAICTEFLLCMHSIRLCYAWCHSHLTTGNRIFG